MDGEKGGFIPVHGQYKKLITYQKALIIYDCTVIFCKRFLQKYDRTIDQMTQAARSGKQNIIEGSMASATSTETEIKLTNVARASLEELLEDYYDFLMAGELKLWDKDSKEASYVRKSSSGKIPLPKKYRETCGTSETSGLEVTSEDSAALHLSQESQKSHSNDEKLRLVFVDFLKTRSSGVCANIAVCLINQCTYLLRRQILQLEEAFVKKGGLRENMYKARVKYRNNN